MEGYINYKFDLEIPLIFSIFSEEKKEYRQLEIKTNKSKDEFFRSSDTDKWGTIERYWNLCVPEDNKGFSMTGYNDKLTLEDIGGKIYLELYHYPHSTLTVKPQEITWNKDNLIQVKIESVKIREGLEIRQIELKGEEFGKRNKDYQDLILNFISKKKELKINFRSDNNAYFRKPTSFQDEALVILPDSLQEDLINQNNPPSNPNKSIYFFLAGILILTFILLVFWLIKLRKPRKK